MRLQDITETTTIHRRTGEERTSINDEQVKVQGYNVLHESRPAAGAAGFYFPGSNLKKSFINEGSSALTASKAEFPERGTGKKCLRSRRPGNRIDFWEGDSPDPAGK